MRQANYVSKYPKKISKKNLIKGERKREGEGGEEKYDSKKIGITNKKRGDTVYLYKKNYAYWIL